MNYLIKNGRIINPLKNQDFIGDVLITNGIITKIDENIQSDFRVIDAKGLCVSPGLVDMHVHLRDPGLLYKEDIFSGCEAACAGGVTSVLCMPNTLPTIDSVDTVNYISEKSKEAKAKVYITAAITKSLDGEILCNFEELKNAGVIALSDDGKPVTDSSLLMEAMIQADKLGLIIVAHCEDLSLVKFPYMNEGEISNKLGIKGIHNAAEDCGTAREIALASALSVPVHICHVSTKNSAQLIREAKQRGEKVSGETAPHYLIFTDSELLKQDADYRMNPPLRSEIDRLAIIEAVLDGTLEVIATDHAPHSVDEKSDFLKAPNGVIGMETSLAATITALGNKVSLGKIIELMSCNPAKILGIEAGLLETGKPADIVIFNPHEKWIVDVDKLHGKSKNSIFKGMELTGKVKYTLLNGKIVYSDGILSI